jgi:hypothetical protein
MSSFIDKIIVEDDGLLLPTVANYAEEKYKIVHTYCNIFATGMKKL